MNAIIGGGWFVNWSEAAAVLAALACLVVAVIAGRFRRGPRRIVRVVTLLLAPVLLGAWIWAQFSMAGPTLGSTAAPWAVVPALFGNRTHDWGGGEYGVPDPRTRRCRSRTELEAEGVALPPIWSSGRRPVIRQVRFPLVPIGHFAGPFGAASVFVARGTAHDGLPNAALVEIADDCYVLYPPFDPHVP